MAVNPPLAVNKSVTSAFPSVVSPTIKAAPTLLNIPELQIAPVFDKIAVFVKPRLISPDSALNPPVVVS